MLATFAIVVIGVLIPESPLSHVLGFAALPVTFVLALTGRSSPTSASSAPATSTRCALQHLALLRDDRRAGV